MDPLPSIDKVYSLLRQRSVGHDNSVHIESTTLVVKGSNPNFNSNFPGFSSNYGGNNSKGKDRPICTIVGSLVMSWRNAYLKPKGKNFMVNQVNAQEDYADKDSTSAHFPFTQEQCQ